MIEPAVWQKKESLLKSVDKKSMLILSIIISLDSLMAPIDVYGGNIKELSLQIFPDGSWPEAE
jgi:hypothetical protein